MTIHVVRLGTERLENEGVRIGTVRRPPRGVPKAEFSSDNWYDTWLPNIAPTPGTMKLGQNAKTDKDWKMFEKKYRAEMKRPEALRILELLTAMSHQTNFSIGCYCENEMRCHRSVLKQILIEIGAIVA